MCTWCIRHGCICREYSECICSERGRCCAFGGGTNKCDRVPKFGTLMRGTMKELDRHR